LFFFKRLVHQEICEIDFDPFATDFKKADLKPDFCVKAKLYVQMQVAIVFICR